MDPYQRKPKRQKKQPQVDLKQADTIKCSDCNNYLFITSFVLKKISALMSPNGQEGIVPLQVYSCGNCGKVPSKLLEGSGLEIEPNPDDLPSLEV